MYVAVDPGKQVGYAFWNSKGEFKSKGEIPMDAFYDLLEVFQESGESHVFILEDYRLDPAKPQGGSRMEASQVIGAVQYVARCSDSSVYLQQPAILFMAQKWTGKKVPAHGVKGHDEYSAYNHGIHYLVTHKIIKNPAIDRIKRSGNG